MSALNIQNICHNISVVIDFDQLNKDHKQPELAVYKGRLFIHSKKAEGIPATIYQFFLKLFRDLFYGKTISVDEEAIEALESQAREYSEIFKERSTVEGQDIWVDDDDLKNRFNAAKSLIEKMELLIAEVNYTQPDLDLKEDLRRSGIQVRINLTKEEKRQIDSRETAVKKLNKLFAKSSR